MRREARRICPGDTPAGPAPRLPPRETGIGPGTMTAALTIARYTALEAARSRFAGLVAGYTIAGCALALFAGELAVTEARGFRGGLLGAWLRVCAIFTVSLFVITSMVRESQDKGLELVLSMPLARGTYYAGKLAGFAGVSMLPALACAPALVWFAPPAQIALWTASLGLELLIVIAMSLLCVLAFSQTTWVLSTVAGFYLLSRAMTALQLMAHGSPAAEASLSRQVTGALVDALAFILPDLDRFTESDWLVYGAGTVADLGFVAMQTLVYVAFLCAAGLFDLYRKAL